MSKCFVLSLLQLHLEYLSDLFYILTVPFDQFYLRIRIRCWFPQKMCHMQLAFTVSNDFFTQNFFKLNVTQLHMFNCSIWMNLFSCPFSIDFAIYPSG